jgi:hypothetical protein
MSWTWTEGPAAVAVPALKLLPAAAVHGLSPSCVGCRRSRPRRPRQPCHGGLHATDIARIRRIVGSLLLAALAALAPTGSIGTIATGNVGVRTTLGIVSNDEVQPGISFQWPLLSSVVEYSANEIAIDLNDLTPKVRHNLSLRDMAVTVY